MLETFNNALDRNNSAGWHELQQSQLGSEELLSNIEAYASYLALTINNTDDTIQYSSQNLGEYRYLMHVCIIF